MKLLIVSITLSVLLIGCAGKQEKASVNSSPTPTATQEAQTTRAETPSLSPTPSATLSTERPVEFTYLGVSTDKEHINYKIKVTTAKPISQVDLGMKYMDDNGKVLDETTLAWQNIVHSKRMPIEKGKTYNVEDYLPEGATKAEAVLKRVIFEDGTYWKAEEP